MEQLLSGLQSFEIDNFFDLILDFSSSSRKKIEGLKAKKEKILKSIEESYKTIELRKHRLYNLEELKKLLEKKTGINSSILCLLVLEEINNVKKEIVSLRPSKLLDDKMVLTHEIEKLTIKSSIYKYLQDAYGNKKKYTG